MEVNKNGLKKMSIVLGILNCPLDLDILELGVK